MLYALEAASLEKTDSRGVKALAGVDIKVRSGTIFGLLGPNGAGKSTTVKTGRENLELQAVLFLDEPTIGLDPKARVDMWHEIERLARDEGVTILLTTRERESLIGIVSLVTLPLIFLPTALMQASLLPHWVRWASRVNPVDWAVDASRSGPTQSADWGLIGSRVGFVILLLLTSATFATRAFRSYQRSI